MSQFVLTVDCPSTRGIVAAVSSYLAARGCNIIDSAQFVDVDKNRFFMRVGSNSEEGASLQHYREELCAGGRAFRHELSVP